MGCKMLQWLDKLWEGNKVFEEAICFTRSDQGELLGGELIYTPTKILKVTAADGSYIYEEGKDYVIKEGKLQLTDNTTIKVLPREVYCVPYNGEADCGWLRIVGGERYLKIYPEVYQYQLMVTYEHEEHWKGFIPENMSNLLPRTMSKLAAKEKVKLVFYGDSITAGWEASGCDEQVIDMYTIEEKHLSLSRPPYMPAWVSLVTAALEDKFDHPNITKVNRGAGGSTASWGNIHADKLVNPHKPDLVVVAFGMNNIHADPQDYYNDILGILTTIRNSNPECEFLLVSPMVGNPEMEIFTCHKMPEHQEELYKLHRTLPGVALAPVHTMFLELLRQGKNYMDITGNCINHPNDFSVRIYAQMVLSALGL